MKKEMGWEQQHAPTPPTPTDYTMGNGAQHPLSPEHPILNFHRAPPFVAGCCLPTLYYKYELICQGSEMVQDL